MNLEGEYRQKAAELEELAHRLRYDAHRERLFDQARRWRSLAEQIGGSAPNPDSAPSV